MSTVTGGQGNIVKDGLVLWLDAANPRSYAPPYTGTTWISLVGSNNGTLTNGPTFNSANGGSIVFDGVDDRVDTNFIQNIPSGGNFTVDVWFKGLGSAVNDIIVSNYNNTPLPWNLYQLNNGKFRCISRDNSDIMVTTTSTTSTNTNNWFYGTYSKLGNLFSLYVNGKLESTSTANLGAITPNIGIKIGNYLFLDQPYHGRISNFKVYNRALSASEISQNFNATRARFGI